MSLRYADAALIIYNYAQELLSAHQKAKSYQEKYEIMRKIEALEEISKRLAEYSDKQVEETTGYSKEYKKWLSEA